MTPGPDFNWVEARSRCSLAKAFEQIKLEVEADIAFRNGQRVKPYYYEFSIVTPSHGPSSFIALVSGNAVSQKVVTFRLTNTGIAVFKDSTSGQPTVEASVTLNNEGECRLKINGREYEFWQFRRMALEELLFESVRTE